ncbi:MAG: hypothetical protein ACXABY_27460 [Candidatus Thorarchaeota archaeon]|jgi:hypothetical protein
MTVEEVRERIAKIASLDDDEQMHIDEDRLYVAVLGFIAHGALTIEDAQQLAEEVLTTKQLKFRRWCA